MYMCNKSGLYSNLIQCVLDQDCRTCHISSILLISLFHLGYVCRFSVIFLMSVVRFSGALQPIFVKEGDIIVAGSDGLFDNIFDPEIERTVNELDAASELTPENV